MLHQRSSLEGQYGAFCLRCSLRTLIMQLHQQETRDQHGAVRCLLFVLFAAHADHAATSAAFVIIMLV